MAIPSDPVDMLAQFYRNLRSRFDPDDGVLWQIMSPTGRPCFTSEMIAEMREHAVLLELSGGKTSHGGRVVDINYLVFASAVPGVFNLGGDLSLFHALITRRDRARLMEYAEQCINELIRRIHCYDLPLTTISLVQGEALGGGFEAALASSVLIAEKRARMGFPEILFNLFPGMGAYSLLARKVGQRVAEELILSGEVYSAADLYARGIVDILVDDTRGDEAVRAFVRERQRRRNGYRAVVKARERYRERVTRQELIDIVTIWVDAALELEPRNLKMMDRLVRAQSKLAERTVAP